jgi:heptose-I-phosphate ethanolaminephosphotransferase
VLGALLLYVPYGIRILHILTFGTVIDRGGMMALFDTDAAEAGGFALHFLTWKNGIALGLMLGAIIAAMRFIGPFDRLRRLETWRKTTFFALVLAFGCGLFAKEESRHLAPFEFYYQWKSFRWELNRLRITRMRQFPKFAGISRAFDAPDGQTAVIVIGESAQRGHFSFFGYGRDTNPFLGKIRPELFLFGRIVSPHVQTLTTLQKALTFADARDMEPMYNKGSAINFFKDAGFKVFWLSNQASGGRHDDFTGIIAGEADVSMFSADVEEKYGGGDTALLVPYGEALADPAPKKAIFLHLMGSHVGYDDKSPPEFKAWGVPPAAKKWQRRLDEYDNSIRYTDYLLSRMVDGLRGRKGANWLLYFSDHGEDADDENSCFCHSATLNTKNMHEVPLILWLSPEYRRRRPEFAARLAGYAGRYHNTQDIIHGALDLAGFRHPDVDTKKSLFSPDYAEPKEEKLWR